MKKIRDWKDILFDSIMNEEKPLLEKILEAHDNEEILILDGFNMAVIGYDEQQSKLIYSVTKALQILSQDMTPDEATEYFHYNVSGAYLGEKTPIWCWDNY